MSASESASNKEWLRSFPCYPAVKPLRLPYRFVGHTFRTLDGRLVVSGDLAVLYSSAFRREGRRVEFSARARHGNRPMREFPFDRYVSDVERLGLKMMKRCAKRWAGGLMCCVCWRGRGSCECWSGGIF